MKILRSVVLISFFIMNSQMSWGQTCLAPEPPLSAQVSWDVHPNGLLFVGYDTDQNGKADFYSLRNMVQSYFSPISVQKVRGNNQAHLVFYVHYQSDNFYYIVLKQPVFYAVDVNEDGHWDLMFKDPMMDGVNGNESYYESPSGMFTHCPEECP